MEVILRQAVEKLGQPGDVVKVSPGFARNYLLPRGIAYAATDGNLKRIAQEKARLEAAENERRGSAQGLATQLENVSLTALRWADENRVSANAHVHYAWAMRASAPPTPRPGREASRPRGTSAFAPGYTIRIGPDSPE